jgi:hypothetical protein
MQIQPFGSRKFRDAIVCEIFKEEKAIESDSPGGVGITQSC